MVNKDNRRRILTVALALLALVPCWGEELPVSGQYWGFAGGTSIGYGLSYRSWSEDVGIQVTAAPIISNGGQAGSLGVTGLWSLQDLKWTKFFLYAGASGQGSRSNDGSGWYGRAAAGAGIGFEFLWFDHIALDLMAGYGFQATFPRMTDFGTTFSVESGLFYRTKL